MPRLFSGSARAARVSLLPLFILFWLLSGPPARVRAADPPTPKPGSFEDFRLIAERNIFDKERRKPPPPGAPRREPVERPQRPEVLSLTGTIRYAGKAFAFFDSSESRYRGVFELGQTNAGFRLIDITSHGVTLADVADGTRQLTLRVGQQLQRTGDVPWGLASTRLTVERPDSSSPGSSAPARTENRPGSETKPATEQAGAGSSDMDEIMRRLMERRKRELGQ